MLRKLGLFCFLLIILVAVSGCATCNKETEENQNLKNQVSTLESQAQSKDEEISSLRDALAKAAQEKEKVECAKTMKVIGEIKTRPNIKQVQVALQNAGYNPGPIDGKTGKQTIEAIKAFQKANGLEADGKVGGKTWSMLKDYLYKKSK